MQCKPATLIISQMCTPGSSRRGRVSVRHSRPSAQLPDSHPDTSAAIKARVLVVTASANSAAQFAATMNCIFAAAKQAGPAVAKGHAPHAPQKVPIDVVDAGASASLLLQQAAELTGGLHTHATQPQLLRPYLVVWTGQRLQHSPMTTQARTFLNVEDRAGVTTAQRTEHCNAQPSCVCHQSPVSKGFVCSVCLSSLSNTFGTPRIHVRQSTASRSSRAPHASRPRSSSLFQLVRITCLNSRRKERVPNTE